MELEVEANSCEEAHEKALREAGEGWEVEYCAEYRRLTRDTA
jgi:hypothetical protein